MKKEQYERTELDVLIFPTQDIIMTTGEEPDEYEWIVPKT